MIVAECLWGKSFVGGRLGRTWEWLGDVLLRQAALNWATNGWLLSLALNTSFFMRFYGSFMLSDLFNSPICPGRSEKSSVVTLPEEAG